MTALLSDLSTYKHPAVVRRFQREHPELADRAEILFEDLKQFFWASRTHELERRQNPDDDALNFVFIMDRSMRDIDRMWHLFLLYTKDYMEFCDRYFGEYLHHLPDLVPILVRDDFDAEANLRKFLGFVHDRLGAETLVRWFPEGA